MRKRALWKRMAASVMTAVMLLTSTSTGFAAEESVIPEEVTEVQDSLTESVVAEAEAEAYNYEEEVVEPEEENISVEEEIVSEDILPTESLTDGEILEADGIVEEEDQILNAQDEDDMLHIAWHTNGGQRQDEYQDEESGEWVSFPTSDSLETIDEIGEDVWISDQGFTRSGYVLTGWDEDPEADPANPTYPVYQYASFSDQWVTLYAIWSEAHTVTWHAEGGKFQVREWDSAAGEEVDKTYTKISHEYASGQSFYMGSWQNGFYSAELVRDGYILTGWTDGDGNHYGEWDDYEGELTGDLNLYAEWSEAHTVTWHANGGQFEVSEWDEESQGTEDRTLTEISNDYASGQSFYMGSWQDGFMSADLVRDGYVLTGWTDGDGNSYSKWDNYEGELTGDLDFYAVWKKAVHVTWDANGGYYLDEETDEHVPTAVTEEADGEKLEDYGPTPEIDDGRMFNYWSKDREGNERLEWDEDDEYLDAVAYEDLTFYAQWVSGIQITFDLNGGYSQEEDDDEKITDPVVRSYKPESTIWGDDVSCYKEGKKLIGWSETEGSNEIFLDYYYDLEVTEDLDGKTLYAVWADAVTVTFLYNGGYDEDEPQVTSCKKEAAAGALSVFEFGYLVHPAGKTLTGWKDEAKGTVYASDQYGDVRITSAYKGMVLTAQWSDSAHVTFHANLDGAYVEYDDDDDEWLDVCTKTFGMGMAVELLVWPDFEGDAENNHYEFMGWSLNADGSGTLYWPEEDTYTVTGDVDFYAVWQRNHRVTLDANGGYFAWDDEESETDWYSVPLGESVYLTSNVNAPGEGYALLGWSEDPDSEDPEYEQGNSFVPSEDTTLYAIWTNDIVTLTWHANGGELYYYGEPLDTDEYVTSIAAGKALNSISGVDAQIDDDTLAFNGWRKTPDGEYANFDVAITEDTDLYASWGEAAWITYDANGGLIKFGGTETYRVKYVKGTYPSNTWITGYKESDTSDTFLGWTTKKDDKSTLVKFYADNAVISETYQVTGNATLYALYQSTVTKQQNAAKQAAEAARKAAEAAKKAAAQKAFSLNVKAGASVPLQVKKTSKKVEVKTIAAGDKLKSAVSSNTKAATASVSGSTVVLKGGKKTGTAEITVTTTQGATLKFKVKVQKKAVKLKGVKVAKKSVSLKVGQTFNLEGVTNPITAKEKVKYKSSKKAVAAVSSKGVITAKKKGKAVITVSAGKKKVKVKVTVK